LDVRFGIHQNVLHRLVEPIHNAGHDEQARYPNRDSDHGNPRDCTDGRDLISALEVSKRNKVGEASHYAGVLGT
jgi:hypothetical protein